MTAPPTGHHSVWHNLIGQPHALAQLRAELSHAQPTHAWLFTGPPGSGRSVAARAFAAALCCTHFLGPGEDNSQAGCGHCAGCQAVFTQTHPDVTVFATEEVQYRIEQVRQWLDLAYRRPLNGRWRIIIVEDADRMTERTTNVLLKALEEPPPHTLWFLCAPSPADVLVTIRSRCRPVRLQIPAAEAVTELLEAEGIAHPTAVQAVRLAQNHVGVARWLASEPAALKRRLTMAGLPLQARSVAAAASLAEKLVVTATEEAEASTAQRNESELQALRTSLGVAEGEAIPPKLRFHQRQLEEKHKRRARRSVNDALDRAMLDMASFYRDCLSVQLGTGAELVNAELSQDLLDYAELSSPEHALECMQAIDVARHRIQANVPHLLAMEALAMTFVPPHRR